MSTQKKNVLLVSLDDAVSWRHYRTMFGAELQVPNLDRICAEATVFDAAYCQAPICGPSRASFMSAKAPPQLGIYDNTADVFDVLPATEMWSVRLRDAGYYCSSGGKLHHRYKPLRRRFHKDIYDDNQKRFTDDMHMPPGLEKKKFGGHRGGWGTTDPKDDDTYYDHQVAESAIEFLQTYDGDAPFYREVGFYSPHGPQYTPARFKEMYDVNAFKPPECWKDGFPDEPFIRDRVPPNDRLEAGKLTWWRQSVRNYFSALSHGDHHLGRVWDALMASPHAENTLVVLVADHGFHLGDRNRFSKFTLFEQVAGVPFVIWDPARRQAQTVDDPVSLLDLGPTVLDHVGLDPRDDWVGRSLVPLLDGARDPDRVVPTFSNDGVSIRKGRYRFIRYENGETQLFDVVDDFWQQRDLGPDHPEHGALLKALVESARAHGLDIAA
ncbi:sulfatase-like hydrolase/transferase [Maribius pontilimi]|uniref:Sulfatase-like hydrolase/transferase n=1 Tax=Palleronia pontilimi TaxID=1964209 RepID=A0A934IAY6_9RHOB|nr:sulfatase-like hydrolase/transferase [Palleronia pontilimi]MBJ3763748.1 sulfatase-like hydrolase/transferase [Palleronia pontilimi]